MTAEVKLDMGWSTAIFNDQVWPIIKQKYTNAGTLLPMEGRPDVELARSLDTLSGIDGWELTTGGGMRGIAARVQVTERPWKSFTVRMSRDSGADTEFAKRRLAINGNQGLIYPHLTIQAYADTKSGPVSSVGICRTADLIKFIEEGRHELRRAPNASFAACFWAQMTKHGACVWVIDKNPHPELF